MITVDPRNPKEIPEIIFMGSELSKLLGIMNTKVIFLLFKAIQQYKASFQENYREWNNSFNLLFNLEELLNMKLPRKSELVEEVSLISV